MTPIEDKIRKLLALAAHPNTPVDEARTSAVLAAKLMAEHGIDVGAAPETPFLGPPAQSFLGLMIFDLITAMTARARQARPPPPRSEPVEPMMTPEFWAEWARRQEKKKKPRRRVRKSTNRKRKTNGSQR